MVDVSILVVATNDFVFDSLALPNMVENKTKSTGAEIQPIYFLIIKVRIL